MSKEGDLPRSVDMDEPALETHNRVPVDEAHPSTGVHAEPRVPTTDIDLQQTGGAPRAEAPRAPMGPDTLSGSRMTNMPTPPIPRADRDPTAEDAGMYGGVEEARDKSSDDEDRHPE
jgi:hypothetical protein